MMRRLSLVPCTALLALAGCGALNNNTTAGEETSATGEDTESPPTSSDPTDGGGGVKTVTIFDLQQGKVAEQSLVRVQDAVVVSPMWFTKSGAGNVFIQDAKGGEYSGIQLYVYPDTAMQLMSEGKVPQVGDTVTILGEYVEYKPMEATTDETFSEVNISLAADLTITGTGAVPTPPEVDPASIATGGAKAENWESVPVTVKDVTVTNPDLGFGEFEVTGGLRVDDTFFLPAGGPKPPMGTKLTLTGPVIYSFDNFKIIPRTCDDFVGFDCSAPVDTDTDTDTGPGPMVDSTIFDIQQGMVDPMSVVTIKDVVVTSPLTFKGDGFFVQDPAGGEYSGIYVYLGMNAAMVAVKPGDVVTITGLYNEYYDMSQLSATQEGDITVTGTAEVPAPTVVAAADIATGGPKAENWEGVLVTVEGAVVTTEADQFGEWIIEGGLHVDDLFFASADWAKPAVGAMFASITGQLVYSFENFKLSPRSAADLVE